MGNYKGTIPWNKGLTKFTNASVLKTSETMRSKKIDNFLKWRNHAKLLGIIPRSDTKIKHSTELATLIGIILGDGNISRFPRTECLRIILGTDKPELAEYAKSLIIEVFRKDPTLIKRSNSECYNLTLYQKNLGKRLGIPIGARAKMSITLPLWIWKNKTYLIAALKGLFEAEASYCVHLKTYTYNFEFSNRNISLLNEVEKALKSLGFNPERRKTSVRLRKKQEAINFRSLIGFRTYPVI